MSASLRPCFLKAFRIMRPNCRRHSFIIWCAARPTACIVSAQNTNASSTPRNMPPRTRGFIRVTL